MERRFRKKKKEEEATAAAAGRSIEKAFCLFLVLVDWHRHIRAARATGDGGRYISRRRGSDRDVEEEEEVWGELRYFMRIPPRLHILISFPSLFIPTERVFPEPTNWDQDLRGKNCVEFNQVDLYRRSPGFSLTSLFSLYYICFIAKQFLSSSQCQGQCKTKERPSFFVSCQN